MRAAFGGSLNFIIMIFTIISMAIVILYLIAAYFIAGKDIPTSISSTYYVIKNKILFSIVIAVSSLLLLIPFTEVTPDKYMLFPVLGTIGMLMVGIFPDTTEKLNNRLHMIGGVGGCVCYNIWTSLIGTWYLSVSWASLIVFSLWLSKTNKIDKRDKVLFHIKDHIIFWIEIITLFGIYGTLFVVA